MGGEVGKMGVTFSSCPGEPRRGHNSFMADDWLDDDDMTREETLARFEALKPEVTRGPLPAGGRFVGVSNTYGSRTLETQFATRPGFQLSTS